ncbi:hypothetical protein DPMN_095516 [Dreissena polymorpha]|uniref:Uncharacterized protein n=1 Tax=Dreissena polymorpha TaxID=45954 RepID=A0A9D4L851_DREPO|nr:hypothetical protein DPMN_095516 [Dreissena polymorpha]
MPRPLAATFFQPTGTIFELVQDSIGTNHLTKFHEDRTINVASRQFQETKTVFETVQDIIGTHLLTKFHDDRTINKKNAPPPGGHIFQAIRTIFKLVRDIIGTHFLTKFHEHRTINLASRVLTRQILVYTSPIHKRKTSIQADSVLPDKPVCTATANL